MVNRKQLAELFKDALDSSKKTREQIAKRLENLGLPATENKVNEMATGRTLIPAVWASAVWEVTGNDRLACALLPEHLQAALAIGQRVIEASGSLRRAQAELAKLEAAGSQRKVK